jgi:hypothetical protein
MHIYGNIYDNISNTHFMFNNFFFQEIGRLGDMWKNVLEWGRQCITGGRQ